jgi:hypothetical protein
MKINTNILLEPVDTTAEALSIVRFMRGDDCRTRERLSFL